MDPTKAEELAEKWRQDGNKEVTADWFKCRGCHGPDELVWSGDCKIRACCKKDKGLANCSLCGQFPCDLITAFENDQYPHHKVAVANLREMAKKGREE